MHMENAYLKEQIITYMGNKRKILPFIQQIVIELEGKLGRKLSIGDGFAGSGVVSRLFKTSAKELYTNDISSYSYILNKCYLSSPSDEFMIELDKYIEKANNIASLWKEPLPSEQKWVSRHWSPSERIIKKGERTYFTMENGRRIDLLRNYIETVPEEFKYHLLANLLVKTSIHNNTNGQFSAFCKDGDVGAYGGKNSVDVKRITSPIIIETPVLHSNDCNVNISKMDTNAWVKEIPELDLVYYDPPYNKHPYNIYYFMLDIVSDWDKTLVIPDTNRGQPKSWTKSDYNSTIHAEKTFRDLIENTKARYILLSYNDGGIIELKKLDEILGCYGNVSKYPIDHKVYNRLKGLSNYKRVQEFKEVKEFLWLLEKTQVE